MIKLLIVEDDTNLSFLIKRKLEKQGDYSVVCAADGVQGLRELNNFRPDVIVTDLEMSAMDGNAMIEKIRGSGNQIPIIVLTGKVEFLKQSGANMYLKKPFNVQQLDLNIKSLVQQSGIGVSQNRYKIGRFTFDTKNRLLILDTEAESKSFRITPTAVRILEMLARQKGECVERKTIQSTIWGDYDSDSTSHNLDVQIGNLRNIFKNDPCVSIEIIKKTGIILKD